jgi:hypothetical protein
MFDGRRHDFYKIDRRLLAFIRTAASRAPNHSTTLACRNFREALITTACAVREKNQIASILVDLSSAQLDRKQEKKPVDYSRYGVLDYI